MPTKDGVGYGEATKVKVEHLTKILAMHLAITQAVIEKNRFRQLYRYVDLTAGKGYTPEVGTKGSPIVFLEEAESERIRIPYRADFIECNETNIRELEAAVNELCQKNNWQNRELQFHPASYQAIVPRLFPSRDDQEYGLVYVDQSGEAPDWSVLQYISGVRPRMEILIYLPATNIKRTFQYTDKLLSDYIGMVEKKYWLVRKPFSWDSHKWTFLLGTNAPLFKKYKNIQFLRLDSDEAQDVFEKLNLSEKQRQNAVQLPLY